MALRVCAPRLLDAHTRRAIESSELASVEGPADPPPELGEAALRAAAVCATEVPGGEDLRSEHGRVSLAISDETVHLPPIGQVFLTRNALRLICSHLLHTIVTTEPRP